MEQAGDRLRKPEQCSLDSHDNGEQRTEVINLRPTVHGKPHYPYMCKTGRDLHLAQLVLSPSAAGAICNQT